MIFVSENEKDSSGVTLLTTNTPWVPPSNSPPSPQPPPPQKKYLPLQKDTFRFLISQMSTILTMVFCFRMPRSAGVYLLGTGGSIPPNSVGECSHNLPVTQ